MLKWFCKELRFFWNMVNPMHGTDTVFVSRKTGRITGRMSRRDWLKRISAQQPSR